MTDLVDFDALWDFNDPATTEKRFRELLPEEMSRAFKFSDSRHE